MPLFMPYGLEIRTIYVHFSAWSREGKTIDTLYFDYNLGKKMHKKLCGRELKRVHP